MIKKVVLILWAILNSLYISSQEIKVKDMELLQSDISARTNPRLDGNDEPCALIKIIIPAVEGMQFEGWVIGNVKYRPGEYQVYVPSGTKKITFRHPDYAPGEIRFTIPIEGKCTYRVTLDAPQKVGGLESVEQGDAAAMLKQAQNYEKGAGAYSRNIEQAQEWYEKAAEAGSIEAQEYLAEVLYKGIKGFPKDDNKALRWNEACAKRGKSDFIYRTADLYKSINKKEQAITWYKKYNELHPDKDLQMLIAQLYETSSAERNTWLKTAADNGHTEAAFELATRLAPSDIMTASIYYQKAVEENHERAMYDYGTILVTGKYGIKKDEEKGKALLKKAEEKGIDDGPIYDSVEENAKFPGGDDECYKWISNHMEYPKSAKKQGIQGRVIVSFVVNRNGSIVDIKIRKSPDNSLSTEAERLVKMMPKWIPGKKDNKPVRSLFNLLINFRLN